MSLSKKIETKISDQSMKPKKLVRSDKLPVYADEIAEIKMNSHITRLTFGTTSPESELNDTHNIINESVTVVLPTANFIATVSQMMIPIIENETLLEVLAEDYSKLAENAKIQLEKLKSTNK